MLNPYRWCRMPIWPLMVTALVSACSCRSGCGRSHNGPDERDASREMEGKSFRIDPNFTIIIDLLWITKKWPSMEWKISHFVYCRLLFLVTFISDSCIGLNNSGQCECWVLSGSPLQRPNSDVNCTRRLKCNEKHGKSVIYFSILMFIYGMVAAHI